jgi:hypothetical protein
MLTLLFAVVVSASGDPYILRSGAATELSAAQNTALQTLIADKFSGVTYSAINSIVCQSTDDTVKPWGCEVQYWATPSWADIRASLISQVPWYPGYGGTVNTWLVKTTKSWVSSAAWRTHAQSIWAELLASPMLMLSYVRKDGTGVFVASLSYKKSMNQSGIASLVQAGDTLIPDGVAP